MSVFEYFFYILLLIDLSYFSIMTETSSFDLSRLFQLFSSSNVRQNPFERRNIEEPRSLLSVNREACD